MEVGVCLIFISSILLITVNGQQEWEKPPFLEGPHAPEVEFDEYIEERGQVIYMDEELTYKVYLAKINYKGTSTPTIGLFTAGTERILGAQIEKGEDDFWYVVVTEKQDYETSIMQKYTFSVEIVEGTTTYSSRIFLILRNIDDNPPVIEYSSCEIPELYQGKTNCSYTVTDADGDISIKVMKFKIYGPEKDLFGIIETKYDNDAYRMLITLETVNQLDFDKNQLHIFNLQAIDSAELTGSISAIVQVKDMPNMPPMWTNIFATKNFDEKSFQTFTVKAVDGDTQINETIKYKLYNGYDFVNISDDGLITVTGIDRDALKREAFPFDISAYKANNESWETAFTVVFIVNDINDNVPTFETKIFHTEIDEETYLSLEFGTEIFINDIDLAENAQYDVKLIGVSPADAANAFIIIPNEGYQRQKFQITIVNASLLDYEVPEWQKIELEILAIEKYAPDHNGTAKVTIDLINWNDEEPIFPEDKYTATFLETEGKEYYVQTVVAYDRDIDDRVIHSLVGNVQSYLEINESTGVIKISADDAFDYNRQSEIVVQVKAEDTLGFPYHTTYTQLTINLIDVNNKQPEIRMPTETQKVDENVPEGFVITNGIIGSDVDTDAKLEFSIDWSKSYATKQGRNVAQEEYFGCVEIKTVFPNPSNTQMAVGNLIVKEIRPNVTIDFEEFEVLYLNIKLVDTNQTIGTNTAEGMIAIIIEDLNDNAPIWQEGSLESPKYVREAAEKGIIIGSVLATDIDGPIYNKIKYLIKPTNNTPDNLITINSETGQLEVSENKAIDADLPKRYSLYYEITATDCNENTINDTCYETLGSLEISIIDTNNKNPNPLTDEFNTTLYIYEDCKTGYEIVKIKAEDLDRDDPYNEIYFTINYKEHADLRNYFDIDESTGMLYVKLENDFELDRDGDKPTHDVYITLQDNYFQTGGDRNININSTVVNIILLDVNDNAPILPPSSTYSFTISENSEKGVKFPEVINAPDIDEPNTDNSRVQYKILKVTPIDPTSRNDTDKLLDILSPDNKTGTLITNSALKGYWGTYDVSLLAFDLGEPQQSTNETYPLIIKPYNYNKPKFVFPAFEMQSIRLNKERAVAGGVLYFTNNTRLTQIAAFDEDGLEAGEVELIIIGPDEAKEYFTIENFDNNEGRLALLKDIDDNHSQFQVTIRATDKGTDPSSYSTDINVMIAFIPTQGAPVFEDESFTVKFIEFEEGMSEEFDLPKAKDPKNGDDCGDECFDIFYYIFDGDTKDYFKLDKMKNILTLSQELNRTEQAKHEIRIAASNSPNGPEASPESLMIIYIDVREADPRPHFEKNLYASGISTTDELGKNIFTLKASHSENLKIVYKMLMETLVYDPSLESVKDIAFNLNENTGDLTLNFKPQESMKGMFEFNVTATDGDGKKDEAEVKVFLVSDANRISFRFENTVLETESKSNIISEKLTKYFGYQCNIDYILKANDNGIPVEEETEIKTHFIKDDIVVNAEIIEEQKNDIGKMRELREDLRKDMLYLVDITSGSKENVSESLTKLLKILLIVISTVLGLFCIIMIIVYCIKIRSLNNRLKALSTTKFGSQDSGINRIGAAVPGTNKHALEGSNPVWNEEIKAPDFDALSDISGGSGDSDLIGVEDNPQFSYDNKNFSKDEKEPELNPRKLTVYGLNEHGA